MREVQTIYWQAPHNVFNSPFLALYRESSHTGATSAGE